MHRAHEIHAGLGRRVAGCLGRPVEPPPAGWSRRRGRPSLKAGAAQGETAAGINVRKGAVSNMLDEAVVQPLLVTTSALTLATECVRMILKARRAAMAMFPPACSPRGHGCCELNITCTAPDDGRMASGGRRARRPPACIGERVFAVCAGLPIQHVIPALAGVTCMSMSTDVWWLLAADRRHCAGEVTAVPRQRRTTPCLLLRWAMPCPRRIVTHAGRSLLRSWCEDGGSATMHQSYQHDEAMPYTEI